MPPAPLSIADLLHRYAALVSRLDAEITRVAALHDGRLLCRAGCDSCCGRFSLSLVETQALRAAMSALPADLRRMVREAAALQDPAAPCPLLLNRRCAVYPHRPVICRTQGLPIGYIDHQQASIEVSACPMNFGPETNFSANELLFLDEWNESLSSINADLAARLGADPQIRVEISLLAAMAAPG